MNEPIHVVMIDDDLEHIDLLQRSLARPCADGRAEVDFRITSYQEPEAALGAIPADGLVVFLCDYRMPSGTALDWLPHLLRLGVGPVLVMSSQGSEDVASRSHELGASRYLRKDRAFSDGAYLRNALTDAARQFRIEQRNRQLVKELKRANSELELRAAKLQSLTQSAHAFVADVAHDFRTPLSTIKEFAGILCDGIAGPVTDEQVEFLKYVDAAVLDLTHMVDDFLDSAKLRAGMLRLDRASVLPEDLLETIRARVRNRADAKGITIEEHVEPGTPSVWVDAEKCGRVLTNLVVNAVKFSNQNATVRVEIGPDEPGSVRFAVIDEGRGIIEEDLQTIFERFSQVDTTQTSRIKGFGLGLSICSQLALLNFSRLSVDSVYGEGSTFSFTVPADDPAALIRHYGSFVGKTSEGLPLHVIRVRCGLERSVLTQRLRELCYPLDLVLETECMGVVVLGFSEHPDRWIQRLERELAGFVGGGPVEVADLHIWSVPEQLDEMTSRFSGAFEQTGTKHAA